MRGVDWRCTSAAIATIATVLLLTFSLAGVAGGSAGMPAGPMLGHSGPSGPALHALARSAAAALTLSLKNGTVGTTVEATGTGFAATTSSTLKWDSTVLYTANTSATGTLTTNFTVPSAVFGAHTVSLTAGSGSASATFDVNASLVLSPSTGGAGTLVTASGDGFAASSTWTVGWSGTPNIACTGTVAHTGTDGSFSCTFTVPTITPATYTVTANDSATPKNVATTLFSLPLASVSFAPASGMVGDTVTATGAGFVGTTTSGTYAVVLKWMPGGWVLCNPPTDATGAFTCKFTVPADTGGVHLVVATDVIGNKATSSFKVNTSLTLDPTSGPAGTTVTATGSGFASEAAAKVTWAPGGGSLCTATTDTTGSFSCGFVVPSDSTGAHTVTGTAVSTASATFTLNGAFPTVSVAFTTHFAVSTYMPMNLSLAWTITASQPVNTETTSMWLNVSDEGSSACPYIANPSYPPAYWSIVAPPCLVVSIPLSQLLVNGTESYSTVLTVADLTSAGYNGGVLPYDTEYLLQVFVAMTNDGSTTVGGISQGINLLIHPAMATIVAPIPAAGVPTGNVTVAVSYTGDFISGAQVNIYTTKSPAALVFSSGVAVPGIGPRTGIAGSPWQAAIPGTYDAVVNLSGPWGYALFTTPLTVFVAGGGTVYVNHSSYQNNSLIPGLSNGATGMLLLLIGAIIGLIVALALGRMMWGETRPRPAQAWKGQPNECHVCHQGFDDEAALKEHMKKAHGMDT
jgi:hypothetical protein